MKVLFLVALVFPWLAQATPPKLAPAPGASTCFARRYTAEHMKRNPAQKLEGIYVKIGWKTSSEGGQTWRWMAGEVVGIGQGHFYGNTAGCELRANGSLRCSIECDGGSFSLRHSQKFPGAVNFVVPGNYYFPLYRDRLSSDPEEEIETIRLQDNDNRLYRMVPADPRECDAVIRRVEKLGGGC